MDENLLSLLNKAYKSVNNEERSAAEKELLVICSQKPEYFTKVGQIAESGDQMHEQAANLANQVILNMFFNKITITSHYVNTIGLIISSHNSTLRVKQSVIKALSTIIKINKENRLCVETTLRNLAISQNIQDLLSASVMFKALYDSLDLQGYSITSSGDSNYVWMMDYFQSMSRLSIEEANLETLNVTKYFSNILAELMEKAFKTKAQSRDNMRPLQDALLNSSILNQLLMRILKFTLVNGNQIQSCLIACSGNNELDDLVNEIKSNVLKCYCFAIQTLINNRTKGDQKRLNFNTAIPELIQMLIYSLIAYLQQYKLKFILAQRFLPSIVTSSLKILAVCGAQTELYQVYSTNKIILITDIIYPFLITSQEEYRQIEDNPDEFVNLALDTVDKQESDVPKTAAATLLETLCDHIDGSTTFLAQLALFIIQQSIKNLTNATTPLSEQELNFIQLINQKKLFTEFNDVDRIESSLTLLTVMSYLIQKRNDIIFLMEKLLSDYLDYFMNGGSDIVQLRLVLFFGYYCDNLFKNETQSEKMGQYLQILISFVQPQKPALLYQAIDALKDVFEDDDLKAQTRYLILSVFSPLLQGLRFSTYERHFEMIINLIKGEPKSFLDNPQLLADLINVLTYRIIQEQELINQGDKTRYIHINRCWNIIRALPEIPELYQILPALENSLVNLYKMLEQKMDFEEEIILIVTSLIEKLKTVSPTQEQLLVYFPQLLTKQKDRLNNLYELLNLYMFHGTQLFYNEQHQQLYFKLAVQTLTSTHEYISEADQAEGALLIQLGIQLLGPNMKPQILQEIYQLVIKQLQSPNLKQGYLRCRIVGILLSGIYAIPQETYELLKAIFQDILITIQMTTYYSGYDIRLLVVTYCKLIMSQPAFFNTATIKFLTDWLQKQKDQEHLKEESMDDDLEDDDDDDDEFDEEEERQSALLQIEQFKSPLVNYDEFLNFHNTYFSFKEKYPQIVEVMKQELDQPSLKKLQYIISCVRIETSDGVNMSRNIVKVSKRKQVVKQ